MFSRKKKVPAAKERPKNSSTMEFGFGIPSAEDDAELEAELFALTGKKPTSSEMDIGIGDDDDDLEAELARIMGKSSPKKKTQSVVSSEARPIRKLQSKGSIDFSSDVDDEDVDENDPELLGELQMLTLDDEEREDAAEEEDEEEEEEEKEINQLDLIRSRLEMYKAAEAKSTAGKELSRARRFNRGVKTLEKLLKRAQGGEIVPYNEIPPEVATNLKPAAVEPEELERITDPHPIKTDNGPSLPEKEVEFNTYPKHEPSPAEPESKPFFVVPEPEPEPESSSPVEPAPVSIKTNPEPSPAPEDSPIVSLLRSRKDEYKKQALASKKSGDMPMALECVRKIKMCDKLIESCLLGKEVNETDIPPAPITNKPQPKFEILKSSDPGLSSATGEIFSIPKTVNEALNQRLNYYEKALRKAETVGVRTDMRKLADIVKIYQNAIRLHQRGSNIPYERLPTPPGCPPIPIAFKI